MMSPMWSFILVMVMFCAIEGQDTLRRAPNEVTAESSVLEMELNAATSPPKTAVFYFLFLYKCLQIPIFMSYIMYL